MWLKPVRLIDTYFFGSLDFLLSMFVSRNREPPQRPQRILIVNLWGLGDSVCCLPLLDALHKHYPNAAIDVLAHPVNATIFSFSSLPRKIFRFSAGSPFAVLTLFRSYDLVFDLEPFVNVSAFLSFLCGRYRIGFSHRSRGKLYHKSTPLDTTKHIVQNYLDMARLLGISSDTNTLIPLDVPKDAQQSAREKLSSLGLSSFVVGITPGVGHTAKERMWPLDRMAKLIDSLVQRYDADILLIDSAANRADVDRVLSLVRARTRVHSLTDLSLAELVAVISSCTLYVTNDTGPSHIAAAQGTPVYTLFGPMVPALWGPYGPHCTVLHHKLWCSPCVRNADGFFPACFNNEFQKCMKLITVREVLDTIALRFPLS